MVVGFRYKYLMFSRVLIHYYYYYFAANLASSSASKSSSSNDCNEQSSTKGPNGSSRSVVSSILDNLDDTGLSRDGVAHTASVSKGSKKSFGLKLKGKLNDLHDSNSAVDEESSGSSMKDEEHCPRSCSNVNLDHAGARKANPQTAYQVEKWMFPDKAEDPKEQLSLAIVSHEHLKPYVDLTGGCLILCL